MLILVPAEKLKQSLGLQGNEAKEKETRGKQWNLQAA